MSPITYFIGDPLVSTLIPAYTLTPTGCPITLTYQVTMSDGTAFPSQFTFTSTTGAQAINVYTITQTLTGVYILKVTVTDPNSGITNSAQTFQVTIKCTKSISLSNNPIASPITYLIDPNTLVSTTLTLPTYAAQPTGCAIGTFSYQLSYTGTFPVWITQTPTTSTNIIIATKDSTTVGNYLFTLTATDPVSGFSNNSVTFNVIIKVKNATSITVVTTPTNQTYLVGSAALLVSLPTYSWYPSQSIISFSYSLVGAPSFVTLTGTPQKILFQTSATSNTGSYKISIKTTETNSGLTDTQSFTLLVTCVTAIAPQTTMSPITYFIGDPQVSNLIPAYTLTPTGCPITLTYQVTMSDGTAFPSQFTFTSITGAQAISVYTITQTLTGVYNLKVTVADPNSGITNSAQTFQVTIKCTKSISLSTNPIASPITYLIDPNTLVSTTLKLPTYAAQPTGCAIGTFSYLLSYSGTFPVWITQTPTTSTNIVLATNDSTTVGSYLFTLTATDPVSGFSDNSMAFNVIIKVKNATSITVATSPTNQIYLVGSAALLVNFPTYTTQPTQSTTSFTYALVGAPIFVTLNGFSQQIQVHSNTFTDTGSYKIYILTKDTNSGLSDTQSFTLLVTCVTAISPLNLMSSIIYFIGDPQVSTLIPAYTLTPSSCPITLTYQVMMSDETALPQQFTFTSTSGAQAINVYTITQTLTGVYNLKVTVTDQNSGITNSAQTFQVTIKCTKSIDLIKNSIESTFTYLIYTYTLIPMKITLPTYVASPTGCEVGNFSYQLSYSGTFPVWITQTPTTSTNIIISTKDSTNVDSYYFTLTATDPVSGFSNSQVTFTVIMKVKEPPYIIVLTQPTNQIYQIGQASLLFNLPTYILPTYSATSFTYDLVDAPNFVTIAIQSQQIQVQTSIFTDTGSYTISILTTETNSGLTDTQSFTLLVTCITAISPLSAMSSIIYFIGDPQVSNLIPGYTLTPSSCPITLTYQVMMSDGTAMPQQFTFTSTTGAQAINVYTTTQTLTGVYNLKVTATDPISGITNSAQTFQVTIKCTKSIILFTNPIASLITYIIDPNTIVSTTLTLPQYAASPSGCTVGTLIYQLSCSGTFPVWITQTTSINIATIDSTTVGSYLFTLTATDPVSGFSNNSVTFTVIMKLKNATSITVATKPANQTYLVGSAALLVNLPTYTAQPNQSTTSFNYALVDAPSFVILTGSSQQIQVYTSTLADTGSYKISILTTETNSGLSDTQSFTLLVTCITAIFPLSAMSSVIYFIGDPQVSTLIPEYILMPSSCPITLTYQVMMQDGTAMPQQFTFTSTTGAQAINVYTTTQTLTGVYNLKVTVTDPNSGITNSAQTFQVTIKCTQKILLATQPIPTSVTYTINLTSQEILKFQLPNYQPYPAGCVVGTYQYELVMIQPLTSFPLTFITSKPTTSITLATQDISLEGYYTFQLIATDPISNLQNTDVTFKIEITKTQSLSEVISTVIPDQTYRIGSPALLLKVPSYTNTPAYANFKYLYSLAVPTPSFVTLVGPQDQSSIIQIISNNISDVGSHQVTVTTVEVYSQITRQQKFNLLVACVSKLSMLASVQPVVYYIGDQAVSITIPKYTVVPSECPYEVLVTSVTLANGNSLPNTISFDGNNTVNVFSNDYTITGQYFIKVIAQDPKTLINDSDLIFRVTILCTKRIDVLSQNLSSIISFTIDVKQLNILALTQPTYQPFPTQCKIGSYTLQLSDSLNNPIAVPVFISSFNNTSIIISTNDIGFLGTYQYKIIVEEAISGLSNNEIAFQLILSNKVYANSMTLIQSTTIFDQVYVVGGAKLQLLTPQYLYSPSDAILNILQNLLNPPNFVTLVTLGNSVWIQVYTELPSDTGVYSIQIQTKEVQSGLIKTDVIQLVISCVQAMNPAKTISNIVYYVTDPAIIIPISYILTPSGCPNELIYHVSLQDGTFLPGSIQFDLNSNQPSITVLENNYALTNQYQVQVVALDPKTGIKNTDFNFSVTIKCIKSIDIAANPLTDFNYQINLNKPLELNLPVPTFEPNPPQCIAGNYSIQVVFADQGAFPSFITQYPTDFINFATQDVSLVGIYHFKIVATESVSGITNVKDVFSATIIQPIYANLLTVIQGTQISNLTYLIGSKVVYLDSPQYTVSPTNANNQFQYSLSLITPSFLTLVLEPSGVQKLKILSSNPSDTGVYQIKIIVNEIFSGLTQSSSFILTVSCVQTITLSKHLPPILYYIQDSGQQINLPQYTLFPQACPNELQYSATLINGSSMPGSISLISQSGQSLLQIQENDPSHTGIFTVVITAFDPKTALKNSDLIVQVTIKCTKSISLLQNDITNLRHMLQIDPAQISTFSVPTYTVNPLFCLMQPIQLEILYLGTPSTPFPNFVTQYPSSTIVLQANDSMPTGAYRFQVLATEPQSGLQNQDVKFSIVIQNSDCATEISLISSTKIADQVILVGDPALIVNAPTYNYVPLYVNIQFEYQLIVPQSFIQIVNNPQNGATLKIQTSNPLDFGTYQIQLLATEDFSGLTNITSFNLLVTCVRSILPQIQMTDITYYISDPIQAVRLPIFTLVPILCPNQLVYSIKMVDNSILPKSITLDTTKGSEQVKIYEMLPQATGIFKVQVITSDPTTKVYNQVNFTVTINCIKSIQLTNNPLSNVTYNVATTTLQTTNLAIPSYAPNPQNCLVGNFFLQLVYLENQTAQFPLFITQKPNSQIKIATQDISLLGTYNFLIIATDPITGLSNNQVAFSVTLICQVQGLQPSNNGFSNQINYSIGDSTLLQVSLPTYSILPPLCKADYEIQLVSTGRLLQPSTAQSWIWIQEKKYLNVQTSDYSLLGQYGFKIIAKVLAFNIFNSEISFNVKLDCMVQAIDLMTQNWIKKYTYYINPNLDVLVQIPLPKYATFPYACAKPYTISLQQQNSTKNLDQFVNIDNTKQILVLSSTDLKKMGYYSFQLTAKESGGTQNTQVTFRLILDCQVTSIYQVASQNQIYDFQYIIGQASFSISIPTYEELPIGCKKPLTYQLLNTLIDQKQTIDSSVLPAFIKLDKIAGQMTFSGTNMQEGQKIYKFVFLATEPITGVVDQSPYQFNVKVDINNTPPHFQTAPQDITINIDSTSNSTDVWKLPLIMDKENNQISQVSTNLGTAISFLNFEPNLLTFFVDRKQLNAQVIGQYQISIKLIDEFGASSLTNFNVNVISSTNTANNQQGNKQIQLGLKKSDNQTTAIILNIGNSSNPTKDDFLGGVSPLNINDSKITASVDSSNQNIISPVQNQTSLSLISIPLTGKISKVDLLGNFQVTWSDDIYPLNLISLTQKNAVDVKIIWMNLEILTGQAPKPIYTAQIVSVTEAYISFRLMFQDPSLISQGIQLDIVVVNFLNLNFFVRKSDLTPLSQKSQILIQQIPQQLDSSVKQNIVQKAQSQVKSTIGVTASAMAVSNIMSVPAAQFQGCFNTVQLISMQPYHGSNMPPNAKNFFKSIDQMMRGGPLNPQNIMNKMFTDSSSKSVPLLKRQLITSTQLTDEQKAQQIVQTQFPPENPFVQAGFFIMLIFISIFATTSLLILEQTFIHCGRYGLWVKKKIISRLKKIFMFGLMIRAQQFGYVYFILSGINNSTFQQNLLALGSTKQAFNSFLYYLMFAYVTIYPINVSLFLLFSGAQGLKNKKIQSYFGTLYEGLKIENLIDIQTTTVFLVRRFIIGVSIAFFRQYYFFQLEILLVTSLFVTSFYILRMPYESRLNNTAEILNEIMVMFTVYIMHGFSYFIPSLQVRYQLGWIYISIVVVVFAMNLAVIIQKVIQAVIRKVKQSKAKNFSTLVPNAVKKLFLIKRDQILKKKRVLRNQVIDDNYVNSSKKLKRLKIPEDLFVIDEQPQEQSEINIRDDQDRNLNTTKRDLYQRRFEQSPRNGQNFNQNLVETHATLQEIEGQPQRGTNVSKHSNGTNILSNNLCHQDKRTLQSDSEPDLLWIQDQGSFNKGENLLKVIDSVQESECIIGVKQPNIFHKQITPMLQGKITKELAMAHYNEKIDWEFVEKSSKSSQINKQENEFLDLKKQSDHQGEDQNCSQRSQISELLHNLEQQLQTPQNLRDLNALENFYGYQGVEQDFKITHEQDLYPRQGVRLQQSENKNQQKCCGKNKQKNDGNQKVLIGLDELVNEDTFVDSVKIKLPSDALQENESQYQNLDDLELQLQKANTVQKQSIVKNKLSELQDRFKRLDSTLQEAQKIIKTKSGNKFINTNQRKSDLEEELELFALELVPTHQIYQAKEEFKEDDLDIFANEVDEDQRKEEKRDIYNFDDEVQLNIIDAFTPGKDNSMQKSKRRFENRFTNVIDPNIQSKRKNSQHFHLNKPDAFKPNLQVNEASNKDNPSFDNMALSIQKASELIRQQTLDTKKQQVQAKKSFKYKFTINSQDQIDEEGHI